MGNVLTSNEAAELVRLLNKMTWPVPRNVFNALCENLIMSAIELAVIRRKKLGFELLMFYREDEYFKGWHMPGTIMQPGETELSALKRLIASEIKQKVSKPEAVGRMNFLKGSGPGQYKRGQVYATFFTASFHGNYTGDGTFFPLNKIPKDTLSGHKMMIKKIRDVLKK